MTCLSTFFLRMPVTHSTQAGNSKQLLTKTMVLTFQLMSYALNSNSNCSPGRELAVIVVKVFVKAASKHEKDSAARSTA